MNSIQESIRSSLRDAARTCLLLFIVAAPLVSTAEELGPFTAPDIFVTPACWPGCLRSDFPMTWKNVSSFDFSIPANQSVSDVTVSGVWGKPGSFDSSAPVDLFLDGERVASCREFDPCWLDDGVLVPWFFSFSESGSPGFESKFQDGKAQLTAIQLDEISVIVSSLRLSISTVFDPDSDGDGISDSIDNCDFRPNADQRDTDADGIGDACDGDLDGDGIANQSDPDQDGDAVANADDNCPTVPNPGQADTFGSPFGDACDQLQEADCELDPTNPLCGSGAGFNNGQSGDTFAYRWRASGDRFSRDLSRTLDSALGQCRFASLGGGTGFTSVQVEFEPATASGVECCVWQASCRDELNNPGAFSDCDCLEPDCAVEGDLGTSYAFVTWPASNLATPLASDADILPDQCDNCPFTDNLDQVDTDYDGVGDACDPDQDNDGVPNASDDCPLAANASSQGVDSDSDGITDACDVCPGFSNAGNQSDLDGNGLGDLCNSAEDFDGDDWANALDNCPGVANDQNADKDLDGIGDACEDPVQFTSDGCYAVTDSIGPASSMEPTGSFSSIGGLPGTTELTNPASVTAIPIGFPFSFYGESAQSALDASDRGFISFPTGQGSGASGVDPIPTPFSPNGFLSAVWTPLDPPTLRYRTDVVGPGSLRRFILEYEARLVAPSSSDPLMFQYVLFEASNQMEIRSGDDMGATSANAGVTGIERPDGLAGYQLAGVGGYNISNVDMRFIPQSGLSLQSDSDGIVDCIDTCPFLGSADQTDSDGDGNGDLCQCGDTENDGDIDIADATLLRNALAFGGAFIDPNGQLKCNVVGPVNSTSANGLRTDCNVADVALLRRQAQGASTPDPQQCSPALP